MEFSVIGSSQVNPGRNSDTGFCCFDRKWDFQICGGLKRNGSEILNLGQNQSLAWSSKSAFGLPLRASSASHNAVSEGASRIARTKRRNGVKLYVGLPFETVSSCHTLNHSRAMAAGLKALKMLGVDGVELPIWWGIVEKEAMGKYEWGGYLDIVEMVQKLDLKLHVSLHFHSCEKHKIPLPRWVSQVGESDPGIYHTDRLGQQYEGCLSLAVDNLSVFNGMTPLEVYKEFFDNFKQVFSAFMDSTITGLSVGLGPGGELRYPSHRFSVKKSVHHGAGEFQCYDKYMLRSLKQHAEKHGNPLWGLGGPHDAYDLTPISNGFFKENGGSWESPYGDFFLSWYSGMLVSHGDRILSLAASTFQDVPITISGKVPLMHSWYKTCSHPSELAAGFYNTVNRDGYEAIAEIFSRNSCKMILPGVDLSDEHQPVESCSSPESLLKQIKSSCRKHGVEVSGQNLLVCDTSKGFEQMKKHLLDKHGEVDLFTYPRMGSRFFSPEHFTLFSQFIRRLNQQTRIFDDHLEEGEETGESVPGKNYQMQGG